MKNRRARDRPADKQTQADQKHAPFRDEKSDFLSLLNLWRAFEKARAELSRAKLRGCAFRLSSKRMPSGTGRL